MPGPNVPFPPMEAELVDELPQGDQWWYEPKWDGFRGILENDGPELALWSRNGRPLLRYFPELAVLGELLPPHSALDGEIVIERDAKLDFDAMQLRLHPAESRIRKLSAEIPATFIAFDLLLWDGASVAEKPLRERRDELLAHLDVAASPRIAELTRAGRFAISPMSADPEVGRHWLDRLEIIGLDGVIAKRSDLAYAPGSREAVRKVKRHKTADCVIIGYRGTADRVTTLLLGLYRDDGTLDFVGHTSGITAGLRRELTTLLPPLVEDENHLDGERMPGGASRWSRGEDQPWVALRPTLVCEVRFDKMEDARFRHGTRFLRFRPDKDPSECTWTQVRMTAREGDPSVGVLLRR